MQGGHDDLLLNDNNGSNPSTPPIFGLFSGMVPQPGQTNLPLSFIGGGSMAPSSQQNSVPPALRDGPAPNEPAVRASRRSDEKIEVFPAALTDARLGGGVGVGVGVGGLKKEPSSPGKGRKLTDPKKLESSTSGGDAFKDAVKKASDSVAAKNRAEGEDKSAAAEGVEKTKKKKDGDSSGGSGENTSSSDDEEDDEYSEGVKSFPIEGGGKYRDYSKAKLRSDPVASIFAAASSKDPTFPVKLHQILSSGEFEDVIAWLPHGRAFRVLQPKAFEERVIPLFFRHGRYASFARQVNGWGFNRITNGPDYGSYYHELFLRGCPHLCERMRRPQPGAVPRKSRKEMSSEPSPNFYEISEKAPLPELPPRPDPPANAASSTAAQQQQQHNHHAQASALAAQQQQAAAMAHVGFNPQQAAMMGFGGPAMAGFAPNMALAAQSNPMLFQQMQAGMAAQQNMYAAQMMGMHAAGQANLLGAASFFNPAAAGQQPQQQGQGQGGGSGQGGNGSGSGAQDQNQNGATGQWNSMQGNSR